MSNSTREGALLLARIVQMLPRLIDPAVHGMDHIHGVVPVRERGHHHGRGRSRSRSVAVAVKVQVQVETFTSMATATPIAR